MFFWTFHLFGSSDTSTIASRHLCSLDEYRSYSSSYSSSYVKSPLQVSFSDEHFSKTPPLHIYIHIYLQNWEIRNSKSVSIWRQKLATWAYLVLLANFWSFSSCCSTLQQTETNSDRFRTGGPTLIFYAAPAWRFKEDEWTYVFCTLWNEPWVWSHTGDEARERWLWIWLTWMLGQQKCFKVTVQCVLLLLLLLCKVHTALPS